LPTEQRDENRDSPPGYLRQPDPATPRLPSYARATGQNPRNATIEQLLPTEEERLASLRAFAEEKQLSESYNGSGNLFNWFDPWGIRNIERSAQGPPNDPLKVLRWAKRKISGEKGDVWQTLTTEHRQKWEADGVEDSVKGDVDASKDR
jgi:hypothetical protein